MKNSKIIVVIMLSILGMHAQSCCPQRGQTQKLFKTQETFYQTWVVNENERGTNIIIKLTNVDKEVTFDSLIFRGIQLPTFVIGDNGGDTITLKSILTNSLSVLEIDKKVVGQPDQLKYNYKGEKYSFLLKNMRRKDMEYLKKP